MENLEIVYADRRVAVAVKPWGVLSTDEPGGMPELLRAQFQQPQGCFRTVHRLDQVVGGLMVFARSAVASSELSRQIREHQFLKKYLAVVHGQPEQPEGELVDLLGRNKETRTTFVAAEPGKDVQEARLRYRILEKTENLSLLEVTLETGRTHQIRVQFSSRGCPLVGDKKYGAPSEDCPIALWSYNLGFRHPQSGQWMGFAQKPPRCYPWTEFAWTGQEQLDIVDDQGQPTGRQVSRTHAHSQGIQHRTSHVWILRDQAGRRQVLMQRRSDQKDSYPGCYDISSAGHIPAGCDFVTSALRELWEELGVSAAAEDLIYCGQRRFAVDQTFHGQPFHDRQVSNIYLLWLDREPDQFRLQSEEVSQVRWLDLQDFLDGKIQIPNCVSLEELRLAAEKSEM
jgi:23S rRNA-/tRNA-specific pseudouridylate synthase/isopentenyldiphosphate isomerase